MEGCDLFKGRWVPDPNATLYTNFTCSTIPLMRNCFLNGRRDRDFLNWKWKPDRCELPRFDALSFLKWFFRQNHLYEDGRVIGCIYCQEPGMTDLGPGRAIRMAFRAAFRAVNECKNCKKIVSFLRTYSPAHFEGGAWNAGGGCNRTRPVEREDVNRAGPDSEYRKIQEEEVETARNKGRGSNEFEILDVTEMMAMRVDGHPGLHSGNRWMRGTSDCIHWCLPGPVDTWNALLLERIKRLQKMP